MRTGLCVLGALAMLGVGLAGSAPAEAQSAPVVAPLGPQIYLGCSGSPANPTRLRNHTIRNTTAFTVPKGTLVNWASTDSGNGSLVLSADLLPGASVLVAQPGHTPGYSCRAWFFARPDLAVRDVRWGSDPNKAIVTIVNVSPWANAPASSVSARSVRCSGAGVSGDQGSVPPILKGQMKQVVLNVPKAGGDYLLAIVALNGDANLANNTGRSPEFASCP